MPSNIIYRTPSSHNRIQYSDSSGPHRNSDHQIREFNDSVEWIFGNTEEYELGHQGDFPELRLSDPGARVSMGKYWNLYHSAIELTYDGKYRQAGQSYKLASLYLAKIHEPKRWTVVASEFNAALMKAAEFPGCPQSIVARFMQEQSRFLIRERQWYSQANERERSLADLGTTLTCLKMNAEWASRLITQQRALQIWEPILGPEHPKILDMYGSIVSMRASKTADLDKETWRIQPDEHLSGPYELDKIPQLRSLGNLLHLCDGSPEELLQKFHALEKSSISNDQIQRDFALLKYGRSRSFLGGYYSFLKRFDDAEKAFQESQQYMK
jgi:hypothetical protein